MNQTKWNILWLDDEPEKVSSWIEELRDKYDDLLFKQVDFIDSCEQEIANNPGIYHAVILDANGKFSNQPYGEPSMKGFMHLVRLAKSKMPVYIFSGQLQLGQDDVDNNSVQGYVTDELMGEGFNEGENLFDKNDNWRPLFQRLHSDLQSRFSVFAKYPEVKDAVVCFGVHEKSAKELLLWREDHSNPFPAYDALRRVVFDDAIQTEMKAFFQIDTDIEKDRIKSYCMEEWEKSIIFGLYKDIVNKQIHDWPSYDLHVLEVIAHASLIALCWFDRFMQKRLTNPNPADYYKGATPIIEEERQKKTSLISSNEDTVTTTCQVESSVITSRAKKENLPMFEEGVIEQDQNGCYHIGPYLLNAKFASNHVGKKARVIGEIYLKATMQYKKIAKVEFV